MTNVIRLKSILSIESKSNIIMLIRSNPWYISKLSQEKQTDNIIEDALTRDGSTIQFVKDRTLERCNLALDNHPNAWKYL